MYTKKMIVRPPINIYLHIYAHVYIQYIHIYIYHKYNRAPPCQHLFALLPDLFALLPALFRLHLLL